MAREHEVIGNHMDCLIKQKCCRCECRKLESNFPRLREVEKADSGGQRPTRFVKPTENKELKEIKFQKIPFLLR